MTQLVSTGGTPRHPAPIWRYVQRCDRFRGLFRGLFSSLFRSRPAAALALTALLAACTPALNWRDTRPPGGGALQALFPCQPEHHQRQLKVPGLPGGPVQMHLLACEADGARWALSYLDAGSAERRGLALGLLSRSLSQNLGTGGPRDLGAVQIKGMTPDPAARQWWQTGRQPQPEGQSRPVQVRAWHFSHGLMVYQASVWQNPLAPDDPRLTTFAEGFKFSP